MTEENRIELHPAIFRPKSSMKSIRVNFIVHNGGLGDYIGHMACIEWIARYHPQVEAHLYTSDFFTPLAAYFMEKYPRWTVKPYSSLTDEQVRTVPTFGPHYEPINGVGCHPIDLAFIYYLNMNPAPPDAVYPQISECTPYLTTTLLPENYAIMCPGIGGDNRELAPETFNAIADALIDRNLTPVFIGKHEPSMDRLIKFNDDYDLSKGLNLIDKTPLVEALAIISKAKLIVGLDNGLLHMAGCTDIPIIFGYSIASPQHRRPRRPAGKIYEHFPNPHKLTCTFCQSKMRLMFDHDFAKCLYKDYYCLKELANPVPWIALIDKALEESS